MVINFNPKYIPGDIVYNHKKEIIRITSSYLKGTKLFYYRDGECGWIREDAIKPIPLTPEILEKNGWRTQNRRYYYLNVAEGLISYIGIDFKHKSNKGHLYVEVNENSIIEIQYCHELQHLLFGLGINHEMEV